MARISAFSAQPNIVISFFGQDAIVTSVEREVNTEVVTLGLNTITGDQVIHVNFNDVLVVIGLCVDFEPDNIEHWIEQAD